jgi:hypothetical protein
VTDSRPFDDILDECLERLFSADESVEQCLEAYPEHAAELAPLLRTAVATRRAVSVEPDAGFKARARYQFLAEVDRPQSRLRWPRLGWQPRWAMVSLVVLAIVVAGSGTVVAADSSMPGSVLYPVKLATERVRLAMTFSNVDRAEFLAGMVDRRVAEIDYAVAKGRPEHVEQVTGRLMEHLGRMSGLSLAEETPAMAGPADATPEQTPDLPTREIAPSATRGIEAEGRRPEAAASVASGNGRARLKRVVEVHRQRHPARLREALDRAPESARPLLREAITASEDSYDKVLEELEPTRSQDGAGEQTDESDPAAEQPTRLSISGDEATTEPEPTGAEAAETDDGASLSPAKSR